MHGEWFNAPLPVIRKAAEIAARVLPITAKARAKYEALCASYPGSTRSREFRVKAAQISRELFDADDITLN